MQKEFRVGDKAVHPTHGVAEVTGIEKRETAGSAGEFYVLRIMESGMKVLVPAQAADRVGLRAVMSQREADQVLDVLREGDATSVTGSWNRRQRAYNEMMKSGSRQEIARVLRDLYRIKYAGDKPLSFGEQKLLDHARALLVREVALAKGVSEADVERLIEAMFAPSAAA